MNSETHIHIHTDKEPVKNTGQAKKKHKVNQTKDKRKEAVKASQMALKIHTKAMFKGGGGFVKHSFLALLHAFKLLGFGLQSFAQKQQEKNKGKEETFKSPLLEDDNKDKKKNDLLRW